jgi:Mn-dependent DtxR family transcriptional regulator
MLSVRRAGVTIALQRLSRDGLVTAKRGIIVVKNRAGLLLAANGLYGIPEAEYRRLTGWRTKH